VGVALKGDLQPHFNFMEVGFQADDPKAFLVGIFAVVPNMAYIWYVSEPERRHFMKLSESVKPISYLKSHTAEALRDVSEGQRTMVITQHGEAKAVLQDIASYEQTQESLALLKMLAQSSKGIQEGRSKPVKKAFADIRKHIKERAE
jgi:prevent-host-death family protein